jgi:hypothetical protein
VEAHKNSWGASFLSPLTKKVKVSKETKAHDERKSKERRIEQDLKERRLTLQKVQLQEKESGMKQAEERNDAADLRNDNEIRIIEARIQARKGVHEPRRREQAARKRQAKLRQQQHEQREKDAKARKQQFEQWENQAKIRRQQREQRRQREKAARELFMKQQAAAELAR